MFCYYTTVRSVIDCTAHRLPHFRSAFRGCACMRYCSAFILYLVTVCLPYLPTYSALPTYRVTRTHSLCSNVWTYPPPPPHPTPPPPPTLFHGAHTTLLPYIVYHNVTLPGLFAFGDTLRPCAVAAHVVPAHAYHTGLCLQQARCSCIHTLWTFVGTFLLPHITLLPRRGGCFPHHIPACLPVGWFYLRPCYPASIQCRSVFPDVVAAAWRDKHHTAVAAHTTHFTTERL